MIFFFLGGALLLVWVMFKQKDGYLKYAIGALDKKLLPIKYNIGEYEFFTTLTKLDFISRNRSNQYLLGTECDQTIKSFGQGHGRHNKKQKSITIIFFIQYLFKFR